MKIPARARSASSDTPGVPDRPAEWMDPDGRQILSHADTLFSAPAAPGRLVSNGWGEVDALALTEHIGRRVIQGCKSRDFRDGWRKNPDTGKVSPRVYRVGTAALARCQYAVLTHPQRTAVLVLDVDRPHEPGGTVDNLHPEVWKGLTALVAAGLGPAWVGINPVNGKCQLLWLIDPVYAAAGQTSANMRLLSVVTDELNTLLAADHRFSHQFSRWPLHVSDDPTRYRWHCQHSLVMRLGDICKEVRAMNGTANRPRRHTEVQYASGRERIEAARAATAKRKREFVHPSSRDPNVIEGVRVYWVSDGRAARDETAFRHALVTGYRLKESGQKLTDAALIDAYEYAYDLAQSIGADWREPDMPPMRDRQTMARRVRGYVAGGTIPHASTDAPGMSAAGRKALATMGRKGGQKAAQRWQDKNSDYARTELARLQNANALRAFDTDANKGRVIAYVAAERRQQREPTTREIASELNLSIRRVQELRKELGLQSKRGRPKKSAMP